MKKLSRIVSFFTAVALSALCLSGCGKKLPDVKLSVWTSAENCKLFEDFAQRFAQKHSDEANFVITISEEEELSCKETVMSSPENAADLFIFADDQLDDLLSCGALYDVSADAETINGYCGGAESGAVLSSMRDGKYYAYPFIAGNGYFLYYNSEYFTDSDITDLDTILEICKKNGKKFAMDFGSGWYIYSFFKGAGLDVGYNDDKVTNHCDWNSTDKPIKGVDVAEAMLKIACHDGFANLDSDNLVLGAQKGEVIAGVSGAWNAEKLAEAYGEGYAASKLPFYTAADQKLQMASFAGYKLIGISAYSDNTEWAMKFATELTNEENQLELFEERGECPANVKAAESEAVKSSPAVRALSEQSKFSYSQLVADQYWNPTYIFGTIIANKNADNKDLQELLDTMTEEITAQPEAPQS